MDPDLGNLCFEDVFEELRLRGAVAATVVFSGGHDEGGADEIRLWKSATYCDDGTVNSARSEELPFSWRPRVERQTFAEDPGGLWEEAPPYFQQEGEPTAYQRWENPPPGHAEFADSLYQMVAARYGSWCGDFRADGEVTWNLKRYDAGQDDAVIMSTCEYTETADWDSESWGPE